MADVPPDSLKTWLTVWAAAGPLLTAAVGTVWSQRVRKQDRMWQAKQAEIQRQNARNDVLHDRRLEAYHALFSFDFVAPIRHDGTTMGVAASSKLRELAGSVQLHGSGEASNLAVKLTTAIERVRRAEDGDELEDFHRQMWAAFHALRRHARRDLGIDETTDEDSAP